MNDETVIEAPGFRGRVVGRLDEMLVIDAEVDGDIPAHAAEGGEFAIVLSGRFEITLGNALKTCGPGDYLVVAAGEEHQVRVIEPGRLILIGKA